MADPIDAKEPQRMLVKDDEPDVQVDFSDEDYTDGEYEIKPRAGNSEAE